MRKDMVQVVQEVSGVFEIINMCYGLGFNDVEA